MLNFKLQGTYEQRRAEIAGYKYIPGGVPAVCSKESDDDEFKVPSTKKKWATLNKDGQIL